MKNLRHTLALVVATLFLFTSCSSDDDGVVDNPFTPPTAAAFKGLQQNAFNSLKQNATFNAEDGISFQSQAGVTFTIQANCLTLNGTAVTGPVDLEFVEVFERGNMLTTNATTVGQDVNSELKQLITGGAFHIKAFQNGQELEAACGMMLSAPTAITGGEVPGMGPFVGQFDANDNLIWLPQNTEFWVNSGQGTPAYNAFIENFGWFNCDVFVSDPDPKTEIQIAVPQAFNNENSAVYLARVGEPNSLAFIYGQFPIGLEAHIIFLSEHEGSFRYAIKTITVTAGQQVTFTLEETAIASTAVVTQTINNLP